jgi:hypothetical protein
MRFCVPHDRVCRISVGHGLRAIHSVWYVARKGRQRRRGLLSTLFDRTALNDMKQIEPCPKAIRQIRNVWRG